MSSSPVVVGRQSIQDRDGATVGYELLFRSQSAATDAASALSGDQMTAQVALSALDIGLDEVLGGRLAFCNADRGVLVGEVPFVLPPERAVIEVLETVVVDEEVLAGCRRLVDAGYVLALDDFTTFAGDEQLIALAGIVKVDVRQTRGEELTALVAHCRPYGVRLLAEKVETQQEYDELRRLGFDLFQGYYLDRPVVVTGQAVEPGSLSHMRMATMLLGTELDFEELLQLLYGDPGLAVQVMKLASFGRRGETRRKVTTIRDAVLRAGTRTIQDWMALLLLRPAPVQGSDRFVDVLVRARAVELLAARADARVRETGFAAGMLSALDLLLSVPPRQLVETLDVDEGLAEAAFGDPRTGEPTTALSRLVRTAIDFQLGRPVRADAPVGVPDLEVAFAEAFGWAATMLAQIGEAETQVA